MKTKAGAAMAGDNNGLIIIDDADKLPPAPPGRHPLAPVAGSDFRPHPRRSARWPVEAFGLLLVLLLFVLVPFLVWLNAWEQRELRDRLGLILSISVGLLFASIGLGALALVWGLLGQQVAAFYQAAIVRLRMGAPVYAWQIGRLDPIAQERAAYEYEAAGWPSKLHPNLGTRSGGDTRVETNLGAPPALPEPAPDDGLVPADTWLPWLLEAPHAMIAGGTGTGKTTLARVAFGERLRQGYAGIVVDPKGKEWYGVPVIGAGRAFESILGTLDQVRAEMDQRFKAYGAGQRDFEPLCILVDEVPDIMEACRDDRRRLVDGRWSQFVRQLGSLAREVNISVVLMTQSPLVEDIGMNSAMRKNFTRVALGDEAPLLIREERDPARRKLLSEALRGQQYPAALYRRGEVHLLNTSTVPMLAERPVRDAIGWQPAQAAPSATERPLSDVARLTLRAVGGDRQKAARALLAARGTQVRGGWRYEVKEVARALGLRDEEVTKIGRPQ